MFSMWKGTRKVYANQKVHVGGPKTKQLELEEVKRSAHTSLTFTSAPIETLPWRWLGNVTGCTYLPDS